MKQHAEITLETEETIVLREGSRITPAYCPDCGCDALMATPVAIALLSGLTERELFRLVEVAKVHFWETDRLLICLRSINDLIGEIKL